jgi:hypothetical protein
VIGIFADVHRIARRRWDMRRTARILWLPLSVVVSLACARSDKESSDQAKAAAREAAAAAHDAGKAAREAGQAAKDAGEAAVDAGKDAVARAKQTATEVREDVQKRVQTATEKKN